MVEQGENVTETVVIDLVVFGLLGIFNLYIAKFVKPTIRGFFCDDESIRYPMHHSTVTSFVLNSVGISLPILVIISMEYWNKRENRKQYSPFRLGKYKIPSICWNMYKMLACYGSGALFSQTLTDIGKKVIGRLRPNFMDICRPDLQTLCSGVNTYKYIENYKCYPVSDDIDPNISRVSFPSGHSSFSFYVAVFLVLYLQKSFKTKTTIAKPILQFTLLAVAWFVALSRIMNNKHHWSDVLAGILIGSIVAVINTVFIHRIFNSHEYEPATPTSIAPNVLNSSNGSPSEAHAQL